MDTMLLAEFRMLLIHSLTMRILGIVGNRDRTTAIHWRRTGMSSHRELQEEQRAQAKPCHFFALRSSHKRMIAEYLVRVAVECPEFMGSALAHSLLACMFKWNLLPPPQKICDECEIDSRASRRAICSDTPSGSCDPRSGSKRD